MARTGLKHWMLHNDQLASELDDTLKLSPGYDPVRDVDPALTFHAPLLTGPDSIPGAIRARFERNSEGTYQAPRGAFLLSAPDDQSRHEYGPDDEPLGVLMEPANTNKCENYNANPDQTLEGITIVSGAGTVERVNQAAALQRAGLSRVCHAGNIIRITETTGVSAFAVRADGGAGNLNPHIAQVYARVIEGEGRLNLTGGGAPFVEFTNTEFELIELLKTPISDEAALQVQAQPDSIVEFILNDYQETEVRSSVIVTKGAATSRAVDQLSWPLAGAPYGAEKLINGNFASGADDWIAGNGAVLSIDDGRLRVENGAADFGYAEQSIDVAGVEWIRFSGEYFAGNAPGIFRVSTLPGSGNLLNEGVADDQSVEFFVNVGSANTVYISVWNNGNSVGQHNFFDNLSVRGASPILNQSEGMAAIIVKLGFGFDDVGANTQHGMLSLRDGVTSLIYLNRSTTTSAFVTQTRSVGGNVATASIPGNFERGDLFVAAVRWNLADNLQVLCKRLGVWYTGGGAFDTEWETEDALIAMRLPLAPIHGQHVHVWSKDRGRDWLEKYFEGVAN